MNVRLHKVLLSGMVLLHAPVYSATRAPLSTIAASTSPAVSGCDVTPAIPTVPHGAVTFNHTAASDQFKDLQAAINKLHQGDWLVISPGTYAISQHLIIAVDGVTLYGDGATLQSTSPTDGAIVIRSDNVSIYKITMNQNSQIRQTTPWAGGISVYDDRGGKTRQVLGPTIVGNTINNSAGTGIFLYKATRFTVAGNSIYRSLADGIHATSASSTGRIIHNTVRQTGDDMIGIVSYAAGNPNASTAAARYANTTTDGSLDHNIYVAQNNVSDQYWGRGVSVVGGSDVTIENNTISRNPGAAGIYLLRENSYLTFGDHNILVRNNTISEIQTQPPTYIPASIKIILSHHGAIEVASQVNQDEWSNSTYRSWLSVSGIEIAGNTIHDAKFGGIRLGANSAVNDTVSNVSIHDNVLSSVGANAVAVTYPGADSGTLVCSNNQLDGTAWSARCDTNGAGTGKLSVNITGASLSCPSDGSVVSSGPKPPSNVSIQN